MSFLRLGKDNWARTSPTKEGITFIALSLFVGFAAFNTGNNLLYLAFGMMLSFVVASGIISMINLSRIEVQLLHTADIFADTPVRIKFSLKSEKPIIPSYSLTIDIKGTKTYIPYLAANTATTAYIPYTFSTRGWNEIPEARLSTKFPFGFFKKWIKIDLGEEKVLVYPKVREVEIDRESFKERLGDTESEIVGFGDDLRSIKEYNEGDNPKMIHWKTSAKMGRLMVREMQDEESRGAVVEFKPDGNKDRLEYQISRIASVFVELISRGIDVEFIAPDRKFSSRQMGRSPKPVLTYLALFEK